MKKKIAAGLMAAAMIMTALPVCAAESEVTNVSPSGATAVEADIAEADTGEVSYIVSIPDKIDFGTLEMPESDSEAHVKEVGFTVTVVELTGLPARNGLAVLMKDASAEMGTFQLSGVSAANSDKVLEYSVYNSNDADITEDATDYANGYLLAVFTEAGQSEEGTLSLEQNQLLSDPLIENWVGDYMGTINFYTTIGSLTGSN